MGTVGVVHLEQLNGPDGGWTEVYDIDRCQNPDCGRLFGPGRFSLGYRKCPCAEKHGREAHRTFRCRVCRHLSFDLPHDEPVVVVGGDRYSLGA